MRASSKKTKNVDRADGKSQSPWGGTDELIVPDVHAYCLEKAALLSRFQVARAIAPSEVIAILQSAGISFVLVGTYGIGGWIKKPRATQDVDVVVAAKHHKQAIKVLWEAFPHLEADAYEAVTRLRDRETHAVAIDVMKPNQLLYRAVFKHSQTFSTEGQTFRIPSLEMAVVIKWVLMRNPEREYADRYLDAHDFLRMLAVNQYIDPAKLEAVGECAYPGGGKQVVQEVRRIQAGEKLNL
jgi:hypothetical protein